MKEEGVGTPSYIQKEGAIINLCITGEDAKQAEEESWGIVIYERGIARELRF